MRSTNHIHLKKANFTLLAVEAANKQQLSSSLLSSLGSYSTRLLFSHLLIHLIRTMGWFGGGNDKTNEAPSSASRDFTSDDVAAFGGGGGGGGGGNTMSSPGGASGEEMSHFAQNLQQQVIIQQVISSLSDTAFQKCITGKPSDSLSGREAACVHATVNKWMDTNEFMLGRLAKKQQAQQGSGYQ
jgi:hypothetical protein